MTVSTGLDLGTLARIGMALADPTRRRVLVHLTDGPVLAALDLPGSCG